MVFNKLDPLRKSKVNHFIEQMIFNKGDEKNSRNEIFLATLSTMKSPKFIEDRCVNGQYSPILLGYINRIQHELPSMDTIRKLLDNFYRKMYPIWPFIDIDLFEECIQEIIRVNPSNPHKVILNLGTKNIKKKLVNIAILYLILQLSISHLRLFLFDHRFVEKDQHRHDGEREWIEGLQVFAKNLTYSAADLVSILNIYQSRTEEIISWHMYLWAILTHTPDICSVFNDATSEGVLGMMSPLVSDLGLERDPFDFPNPTGNMKVDIRYKNYRRKLWLCFCLICRMEISVKGKYPYKETSNIKSIPGLLDGERGWRLYSSFYQSDMIKENKADVDIMERLYKHVQFMSVFLPYDSLIKDNLGGLSLRDIESTSEDIDNHIRHIQSSCNAMSSRWVKCPTINHTYDMAGFDKIYNISQLLIARSVKLMISDLLTRFFNSQKINNSYELRQTFLYTQRAISDDCKAIRCLIKYFSSEFLPDVPTMGKLFTNRLSQVLLSRCMLHTTLTVLRVDHMLGLSKRRLNQQSFLYEEEQLTCSKFSRFNRQRQQCVRIRCELVALLEELCYASSEEQRYNYLSGFRFALLSDCGMHFLKQNDKRFLMRDILMSDIDANRESSGFMETNFHLLTMEEKENMLLSANSFVHFGDDDLQLLLETIGNHQSEVEDKTDKNPNHKNLFAYNIHTPPVDNFAKQFSMDLSDFAPDFDLVFDYPNPQ